MSKEKTTTFTGEARKANVTRDPDVAVVTCALTGVLANRKQCPSIPYTPAEIGEHNLSRPQGCIGQAEVGL